MVDVGIYAIRASYWLLIFHKVSTTFPIRTPYVDAIPVLGYSEHSVFEV